MKSHLQAIIWTLLKAGNSQGEIERPPASPATPSVPGPSALLSATHQTVAGWPRKLLHPGGVEVQAHGHVQETPEADALGVVIVPTGAANVPKGIADLTQAGYGRIAIGLPASVPVGRYTKAVLEMANLWSAIEPKMIGANNVRQALDYVARGEVDAGFVYGTDAAVMADKVKVALTVPTEVPVLYPIAPVAGSTNAAAAQKFVSFVLTPQTQAMLVKYGFGKP